jgi:hypothetical protein
LPDGASKLKAVFALEFNVRDHDHNVRPCFQQNERFRRVDRLHDAESGFGENVVPEHPHEWFVLDDEDDYCL